MKRIIVERAMKNHENNPLPKSIENKIWNDSFTFGSYVFGGYNPAQSDIDIMVHPKTGITFDMLFPYGAYDPNDDYKDTFFESIYVVFSRNERIYNVIMPYKEETFDAFNRATKTMIDLLALDEVLLDSICTQKHIRVELFETILAAHGISRP